MGSVLVLEARNILTKIQKMGISVKFSLVSAHVGVKANEQADCKTSEEEIHVPFGNGEDKSKIFFRTQSIWGHLETF